MVISKQWEKMKLLSEWNKTKPSAITKLSSGKWTMVYWLSFVWFTPAYFPSVAFQTNSEACVVQIDQEGCTLALVRE